MDGAAPTLVNMAFTGGIGLVYLLALYPVRRAAQRTAGLLRAEHDGFAAFGKHPKNILPVMAGACLAKALLVAVPFTAPGPLIAVLFCTGLRRLPVSSAFSGAWSQDFCTDHRPEHLHSAWRHESLQQRLCRQDWSACCASDH